MARIRYIKPGFFLNEYLAEIDPLGRILFAGLWVIADREGRLEDRPKLIKAQTLPYDECDVDMLLDELANRGFIIRYHVNDMAYIAITEWKKHQKPHNREAESAIPAPDEARPRRVQGTAKEGTRHGQRHDEPGGEWGMGNGEWDKKNTHEQEQQFARLWSLLPKAHGSKKTSKVRFTKLSAEERERCLTAAENLSAYLVAGGDMEFIPLNENFVGGQKARYHEWVGGVPPRYRSGARGGLTPEQIMSGSYLRSPRELPLTIGDGT